MELEKYFFSDKNINKLTQTFGEKYQIQNRNELIACRNILKSQMTMFFEKFKSDLYSQLKSQKMTGRDALKFLNQGSIKLLQKTYTARKQAHNKTPNKQPISQRVQQKGIEDYDTGAGSYAPIASGDGEFITADGRMGKNFAMGGMGANQQPQYSDKKMSQDDIEKQYLMRQTEYTGDVSMMNGGNNMGGNNMGGNDFNMNGMDNMNGGIGDLGMQYNPNLNANRNQRPPEIDFSLDGSGAKRRQEQTSNLQMPQMQGQDNSNQFMGIEGFDNSYQLGNQPMIGTQSFQQPDDLAMNFLKFQNGMNQMPQNNQNMQMDPNMMQQLIQQVVQQTVQSMTGQLGQKPEAEMSNIERINNDIKTKVATKLGLNPQQILSMKSDEIENIMRQKKKQIIERNNDSDDEIVVKKKRKQIVEESEESEDEKMSKKDLLKKLLKQRDEIDKQKENLKQIKKTKIVKNTEKENKEININCKDMTNDPEDYNDYMIDFEDLFKSKLNNITNIKFNNIEIPKTNILNNDCNSLTISFNKESYSFELDNDTYEITELLEILNDGLEELGWGISIKCKNNKIVFQQNDKENFIIECSEKSIAHKLGFKELKYENKYEYIAELNHAFYNDNIYIFIRNIDEKNPYAIIDNENNITYKKTDFEPVISELENLIVQFKIKNNNNYELINFDKQNHKYDLIIETNKS